MINCEQQLVRVQTPSGGRLVIQCEMSQHGPTLCSAARARRYLQQSCVGYVASIMDTRDTGKSTVDDLLIVGEYPDVFPEDLPRLPPER